MSILISSHKNSHGNGICRDELFCDISFLAACKAKYLIYYNA